MVNGMYEADSTLSEDERRLAYVSAIIDGTNEIDVHERAGSLRSGREERRQTSATIAARFATCSIP
jgi:hypothetical protein